MAKALVSKGVEVTLVTTNAGAEQKVEPNRWLSTDYGKAIYHSSRSANLPMRMIFTAIRQISRHDCVHLNSLFFPPSLLVAAVATFQKKPIVWSCRGNLDEQALIFGTWKKKPALWLIRKFLLGAQVTFHSTGAHESLELRKTFGAEARVVEIPNFLELPDLQAHNEQNPKPYLLYVGRLHPIKALDKLLAALARCDHFLNSNFILKIAGNDAGDYAEQLKKQAAELGLDKKVEFLGLVKGEAKQRLFANAYFSILPSQAENFGNVVIESLAQATPVIASKGTPWEILEVEKAGFWTENEPAALASTIEKALKLSPEVYRIFRGNALSLAHRRFDIGANVEVWIKTYEASINSKSTN